MPLSMILIFKSGKENNATALLLTTEKHSYLRAFSHEDLIDVKSTRKSLSSYFGGVTMVHGWLKIIGKT